MSPTESRALVGVVLGVGTLVDGWLLSTRGTADLLPFLSAGPGTWAIAAAGAVVAAGSFAVLGPRLRPVTRLVAPRLYPYAAGWVNAGLFLLLLVTAVAVYAGFFEMFVGAHDNGDLTSVGNQATLSLLIDAATGLLWVAAAYAILLIHRMVSIGRYLDAAGSSTDAAGTALERSSRPAAPARDWTEPPPAAEAPRSTRFAIAIGVSFLAAIGIQVAEVGLAPAAPADWLAGQVLLPAMPLAVTLGCEAIDRGVRDLERRFSRRWPTVPSGAAPPASLT